MTKPSVVKVLVPGRRGPRGDVTPEAQAARAAAEAARNAAIAAKDETAILQDNAALASQTADARASAATAAATAAQTAAQQTVDDRAATLAASTQAVSAKSEAAAAAEQAVTAKNLVNSVIAGESIDVNLASELAGQPAAARRAYVNHDPILANNGLWTRPSGGVDWTQQTSETLQGIAARVSSIQAANENRFVGPFVKIPGFGFAEDVQFDRKTSRVLRATIKGVLHIGTATGLKPARDDAELQSAVETIVDGRVSSIDGPAIADSTGRLWREVRRDRKSKKIIGGVDIKRNTWALVDGVLTMVGAAGGTGSGFQSWIASPTTLMGYYAQTALQKVLAIIVFGGQSNQWAQNPFASDALISGASSEPTALMPNVGLRLTGAEITGFVPLVETTSVPNARESRATSTANHYIRAIRDKVGVTPHVLCMMAAEPGQKYTNLNPGSPRYETFKAGLRDVVRVALLQGYTPIVVAVDWDQGEADKYLPAWRYKAFMRQYVRFLFGDIRQITNQKLDPFLLMTQVAASAGTPGAADFFLRGPPIAHAELHGEFGLRCSGPRYWAPVQSDGLHLINRSHYDIGQQEARALVDEIAGEGAQCLRIRPEGIRWRSETELDIPTTPPVGHLRAILDGVVAPPANGLGGLDLVDDVTGAALTGITFSIPDAVSTQLVRDTIRLKFPDKPTNPFTLYAGVAGAVDFNGPVQGGRTVFYDSLDEPSILDGRLQSNALCAAVVEGIPRP